MQKLLPVLIGVAIVTILVTIQYSDFHLLVPAISFISFAAIDGLIKRQKLILQISILFNLSVVVVLIKQIELGLITAISSFIVFIVFYFGMLIHKKYFHNNKVA